MTSPRRMRCCMPSARHGTTAETRLAERDAALAHQAGEVAALRLEIERLKLLLAKARHEQFGRSSERGAKLIEQLELQLAELEESAAEEETAAEIAAPRQAGLSASGGTVASRPAGRCRRTCRASGSSIRPPAPAPSAAARSASWARTSPRRSSASRGAGRWSSTCGRRSAAAAARRSASRRPPRTRSPVAAPVPTCSPWCWPRSTASICHSPGRVRSTPARGSSSTSPRWRTG